MMIGCFLGVAKKKHPLEVSERQLKFDEFSKTQVGHVKQNTPSPNGPFEKCHMGIDTFVVFFVWGVHLFFFCE